MLVYVLNPDGYGFNTLDKPIYYDKVKLVLRDRPQITGSAVTECHGVLEY